jgi:hypothetical protein
MDRDSLIRIVNASRRCVVGNPAAHGFRWVDVSPERFPGWVANFERRHGPTSVDADFAGFVLTAANGMAARCEVPFPPMTTGPPADAPTSAATPPADPPGAGEPTAARERGEPTAGTGIGVPMPETGRGKSTAQTGRGELPESTAASYARAATAHAAAPRTVGVLLIRLGGYAAGVFTGSPPVLVTSKTGARLVHGRSAAGGWSQHRFARRREKQAAEALAAAAGTALLVFGPYRDRLDAVVLGGDRRAVAGLRDDPRMRPYLALAAARFLTVPGPRLAVLRDTPRLFRAIRVRVTAPPGPSTESPGPGTV